MFNLFKSKKPKPSSLKEFIEGVTGVTQTEASDVDPEWLEVDCDEPVKEPNIPEQAEEEDDEIDFGEAEQFLSDERNDE